MQVHLAYPDFLEVREELADLLRPHAIGQTPPDPALPWLALRSSGWWDLQIPPATPHVTDSDVHRLNLSGGLAEDIYRKVVEDPRFTQAAVQVIARWTRRA